METTKSRMSTKDKESIKDNDIKEKYKVKHTILKSTLQPWILIMVGAGTSFAVNGPGLMFIPYLNQVLKQTTSTALAINRGFQFLLYLTTIFGAIIADNFIGKFKAMLLFFILLLLGLVMLCLSSIPLLLDNGFGFPIFCIALFLFFGFGIGGITPNLSTFIADQIPIENTCYDNTIESVFRYFVWANSIGLLLTILICPLMVKLFNNYLVSFVIPIIILVITILVFIIGKLTINYNQVPIKGNPILKAFRTIKLGLNNNNQQHTHWLDGAKGKEESIEDNYIEDLKKTIKVCKIFLYFIIYLVLNFNTIDLFIIMGLSMQSPTWLSPEQLYLTIPITSIITIPTLDKLLFPILRKNGYKLGPVVRITIGFIICIIGFIYMTILQKIIYSTEPYYDFTNISSNQNVYNNISIWYQIPGYFIVSLADIFASTTILELAYQYAPFELKAVVTSLYYFSICIASLIGMLISIWSYHPNYVIILAVETIAMFICTLIFYWNFKSID